MPMRLEEMMRLIFQRVSTGEILTHKNEWNNLNQGWSLENHLLRAPCSVNQSEDARKKVEKFL